MGTEEAHDTYSPKELESWVLQRRSAEREWQSENHPARERFIRFENLDTFTLVPGGRWLLTPLLDGSISYHDLEDAEMWRSLLTPPRDMPNKEAVYRVAVDIDYTSTSPMSKFDMVSYPADYLSQLYFSSMPYMSDPDSIPGTMTEDQPIAPVDSQSMTGPQWTVFNSHDEHNFKLLSSTQNNEAIHLVLASEHKHKMVYRLVIPHDVDRLPYLLHDMTMTVPRGYFAYVAGTQKTLWKKEVKGLTLFKVGMAYNLDSNAIIVTRRKLNISEDLQDLLSDGPYIPVFADDIGRIVINKQRI
ncbi:hypothetical protein C0992_010417 [Termitomyces sp. T32_za158]|nr:hypothetical protein C0992_010417 [Termitomyces sp. T32_za158]